MTKLMEWLSYATLGLSLWLSLNYSPLSLRIDPDNRKLIFWSPFSLIVAFGVYSICVIAYRVYTFNDVPDAAQELNKEIAAAKKDLKEKGLKF
uniref:Dolichol-phosphate mannosyltransferase subunit 3 n=1 Tax=Lepeophtheirus salmonis TaxID=72036 RepID=D3PHC7_LEPSM|nr:Dolichol-phosphate mannosyltransferase subunit 3 [Lepeophtheirus salmonis]